MCGSTAGNEAGLLGHGGVGGECELGGECGGELAVADPPCAHRRPQQEDGLRPGIALLVN